jgi:hypothetical protein
MNYVPMYMIYDQVGVLTDLKLTSWQNMLGNEIKYAKVRQLSLLKQSSCFKTLSDIFKSNIR